MLGRSHVFKGRLYTHLSPMIVTWNIGASYRVTAVISQLQFMRHKSLYSRAREGERVAGWRLLTCYNPGNESDAGGRDTW
jgi:hypothetical protein